MADIIRAYPGAKQVGADKIDIPGVGVIDVLQSSSTGGVAWQWIDQAYEQTGNPSSQQPNSTVPAPTTPVPGTQTPAPTTPPVSTPTTPAGSVAMDQSLAALMRALGMAVPDAAGLKEASKENLLATDAAARDQMQQRVQAQGIGRSAIPLGAEMSMADDFGGDLTKAYREIDTATQQQGFNNLTGLAGAFQSLGSEQHGQQMDVKRLEQDASQFAAQMGFNYAQLSQQDKQYFQSYALQKWVAEQSAAARQLEILMGGLR